MIYFLDVRVVLDWKYLFVFLTGILFGFLFLLLVYLYSVILSLKKKRKYRRKPIEVDELEIELLIKDAQNLSIFDLAKQIRELATKAVERTIQLPEIQNGTFTITNFGSVGIAYGTPIINYPEVAILGIGKIVKKPIVKDDQITTGFVLPLSLAVDHRIIDGADAGRFLLLIKELLSNPQLMLLR